MWGCNYIPFFGGGWGGGFFPGGFFSLLVWGMVAAVFIYIVLRLRKLFSRQSGRASSDRNDSVSILKVRYAKGELSKDEFVKMKQILTR